MNNKLSAFVKANQVIKEKSRNLDKIFDRFINEENKTLTSSSYYHARHLSKLIPLGPKTTEKKQAVHRLMEAIKVMLKENS